MSRAWQISIKKINKNKKSRLTWMMNDTSKLLNKTFLWNVFKMCIIKYPSGSVDLLKRYSCSLCVQQLCVLLAYVLVCVSVYLCMHLCMWKAEVEELLNKCGHNVRCVCCRVSQWFRCETCKPWYLQAIMCNSVITVFIKKNICNQTVVIVVVKHSNTKYVMYKFSKCWNRLELLKAQSYYLPFCYRGVHVCGSQCMMGVPVSLR